nr:uroporphyrinogen-III synthase [Pseudomonas typographi]
MITRALPGADTQACELRRLGYHAAVLPLVAIEPLAETPEQQAQLSQLGTYRALLVVSQPAARLLLARLAATGRRPPAEPVFAVGAGTAAVLQEQGIDALWPASGEDSEALLAMPALHARLARSAGRVLIVRGQGGREVLAKGLHSHGASVDYLELYRRACPALEGAALLQRIQAERLNALVVSSGQGFEHLRAVAAEHWPALARLALFVPSERVAGLAKAAGARHVFVCAGAGTAALAERLAVSAAP